MRLDPSSQRGDIVVGWLTRIVVILAALGVMGYDALSLTVAKTTVADQANTAALEGADAWLRSRDVDQAYAAVETSALRDGDTVVADSFFVDSDGTVHVRLCRTAVTLLLHRTDTTKKWTNQCGAGRGRSVGP